MNAEARLQELLARCREQNAGGSDVSLRELCQDCPELLPELQRRLCGPEEQAPLLREPHTPTHLPDHSAAAEPSRAESDHPTVPYAPTVPREPRQTTTARTAGQFIGRYRLEALLGRGGFGEVWKAHDSLLLREVAIKMPRPDRSLGSGWSQELLREARKVAALKHPHIVPVFDVYEEGGEGFIISEFIDGPTLAHYIRTNRLPVRESIAIGIGIAEALHHAHLLGFVHRDVKPSNILMDARGQPHLADFGLATSEEEMRRAGPAVLGTLAYMSPEQVRGDSHLLDARSDIYSLGLVLYELLTGCAPFKSSNQLDFQEQIVRRPPRPLRTIDDTIAPELERICLKCLAKSMEDRYPTAADLAHELRTWLNQQDKPAPPVPSGSRWGRSILTVGGLGCVVLAILVGYHVWVTSPTALSETTQQTTRAPVVVQPGVWNNPLDEEPAILFRPARFAHQFDPGKKELWWDSPGDCMIRLGTTQSADYEIEATLEQSVLAGHRGLFIGHPAAVGGKLPLPECHLVLVVSDALQPKYSLIFHARAVVNEAVGHVDITQLGQQARISPRSQSRFTLSVGVRNGRVDWVHIDGVPVVGLTSASSPGKPPLVGDFGVFTDSGSTRLPKSRWKTSIKEP